MLAVACHGVHVGPLQAWYVLSLRSTSCRYSALGFAYNLGAAVLGGTTPLIATSLSTSFGPLGAGAFFAAAAALAAATIALSERCAPIAHDDGLLDRHAHNGHHHTPSDAIELGHCECGAQSEHGTRSEESAQSSAHSVCKPSTAAPKSQGARAEAHARRTESSDAAGVACR